MVPESKRPQIHVLDGADARIENLNALDTEKICKVKEFMSIEQWYMTITFGSLLSKQLNKRKK